jgi:hypothetical protein
MNLMQKPYSRTSESALATGAICQRNVTYVSLPQQCDGVQMNLLKLLRYVAVCLWEPRHALTPQRYVQMLAPRGCLRANRAPTPSNLPVYPSSHPKKAIPQILLS